VILDFLSKYHASQIIMKLTNIRPKYKEVAKVVKFHSEALKTTE